MLTPEYIAGFFDGEGTIGASNRSGQIVVEIANNYKNVLVQIQEVYGGNLTLKNRKGCPRCRPSYRWIITGMKARVFLTAILPYLDQKHEQVRLALSMPYSIRGVLLGPEKSQARKDIAAEIKRLKHLSY